MSKKKYLAFDACDDQYEECDSIDEARAYLKECFLAEGWYNPNMVGSAIYELKETVTYDVVGTVKKDEVTHDWPDDDVDVMEKWNHRFVKYEQE